MTDSVIIDKIFQFSTNFSPNEIPLDKNINSDSLSNYLLKVHEDSLSNRLKEIFSECVNIILLKQYLFHLKCCNQGYDLLLMKKTKPADIIITSFIKKNELEQSSLEMLNSGIVYDLIKSKSDSIPQIKQLIIQIENEKQRIDSKQPWR